MGISIARCCGAALKRVVLVTAQVRNAVTPPIPRIAAGLCCAIAFGTHPGALAQADELTPPSYAQAQADRGADVYSNNCASCHGEHLNDGAFARALTGAAFRREWNGKTLGALGRFILSQMPPGKAGQLTQDQYTDVIAFLLSANGVTAGGSDLPADPGAWEHLAAIVAMRQP